MITFVLCAIVLRYTIISKRGTSARSPVGLLSDQTRESIQRTWSKACKKVGAAAIVIVNEVDEEDYPPIPKNFIYMEKGFH